jgi:hypothetical protein
MTPKANSWTSMGRLALYGPAAARLQEEIIQVTAVWTDAECDRKPLKPFGEVGKAKTLDQLDRACAKPAPLPPEPWPACRPKRIWQISFLR